MKRIKLVVIIACALLLVVVCVQNLEPVQTKLLFMTITMPRVVLLLTTAAGGFAIGFFGRSLLRAKRE